METSTQVTSTTKGHLFQCHPNGSRSNNARVPTKIPEVMPYSADMENYMREKLLDKVQTVNIPSTELAVDESCS